jgi:hypothetical protein
VIARVCKIAWEEIAVKLRATGGNFFWPNELPYSLTVKKLSQVSPREKRSNRGMKGLRASGIEVADEGRKTDGQTTDKCTKLNAESQEIFL